MPGRLEAGLLLGNDVKGLLLMTHGYGARRVGQKNGFFLGASVEGAESHLKERSGVERGAEGIDLLEEEASANSVPAAAV